MLRVVLAWLLFCTAATAQVGQQPRYIQPVVGGGGGSIALDGTPVCNNATTNANAIGPFTTTSTNDVIYVGVTTNGGPVTSITGVAGVTFTLRAKTNLASTQFDELWAGTSTGILSGVTATVNTTTSSFNTSCIYAFSGGHIAAPFDANAAIPNASATGGISCSYTTSNANDMLVQSGRTGSAGFTAASTGFTSAASVNFQQDAFKSVSATQPTVTPGPNGDGSSIKVCDAIILGP